MTGMGESETIYNGMELFSPADVVYNETTKTGCGFRIKEENSMRKFFAILLTLALTLGLAAVYFSFQPLFKKKLSPIALIVIAAVLGLAVYGV